MLDAGKELMAPQHGTEGIETYVKPHFTASQTASDGFERRHH